MVHYIKGNLLDSKENYICHQVNCQGRMGSGVAKQIREKWPAVYDIYRQYANSENLGRISSASIVGNIPIQTVINMYAQNTYGYDGCRYTSYDAFWSCLGEIRKRVPKDATIAFPDHIGCGLGGADWEVIRTMIAQALDDYEVYIYKLEE